MSSISRFLCVPGLDQLTGTEKREISKIVIYRTKTIIVERYPETQLEWQILIRLAWSMPPQGLYKEPIKLEMDISTMRDAHTIDLGRKATICQADVPANCTIISVKTGWIRNMMGAKDGSISWRRLH